MTPTVLSELLLVWSLNGPVHSSTAYCCPIRARLLVMCVLADPNRCASCFAANDGHDAASARNDAASAGHDAAPARNDAAPARNDAAPAGHDAAPAGHDAAAAADDGNDGALRLPSSFRPSVLPSFRPPFPPALLRPSSAYYTRCVCPTDGCP
jgi:hypothetical protein